MHSSSLGGLGQDKQLLCRLYLLRLDSVPSGTNVRSREEVAVKLESTKTDHPQLRFEAHFYRCMQSGGTRGGRGLAPKGGEA